MPLSTQDILLTTLVESSPSDASAVDPSSFDLSTPPPPFTSSSPPNALVRFRCMVQDTTLAPEIFLPTRQGDPRPSGPSTVAAGEEMDYSLLRERTVLWAVGVPGEQDWVDELISPSSSTDSTTSSLTLPTSTADKFPYAQAHLPGSRREKLGAYIKVYDPNQTFTPTSLHIFTGLLTYPSSSPSSSSASSSLSQIPTIHVISSFPYSSSTDLLPPTATTASTATPSIPLLPSIPSTKSAWDSTRDDLLRYISQVGLEGTEPDWVAKWILIGLCSGAPLPSSTSTSGNAAPSHPPISISLLPAAISSSSLPPDLSNLSLSSSPSSIASLPSTLSLLTSQFHPLPLSIKLLNTTSFSPRSRTSPPAAPSLSAIATDENEDEEDYLVQTQEDLQAGALQLPKGGLLWVDERPMGDGGQLNETGLQNIQTLTTLIQHSKLDYVFPFSSFTFPTDLSTFVVGDAKGGTLLPVDIKLPLTSSASLIPSSLTSSSSSSTDPSLPTYRSFILSLRSPPPPPSTPSSTTTPSPPQTTTLPSSLSDTIQSTFIAHRQKHGVSSLSGDQLGVRIRACKVWGSILGLGRRREGEGEEAAGWKKCWEEVWEMDEMRLEALCGDVDVGRMGEKMQGGLLGRPDAGLAATEEEESDDDLEIEGGPVGGSGVGRAKGPIGR